VRQISTYTGSDFIIVNEFNDFKIRFERPDFFNPD
jgi:hypothetical protein